MLPSVGLAFLLNIPRVLEISPLGQVLEQNQSYLIFFMFYQVFSYSFATYKIKPLVFKTVILMGIIWLCFVVATDNLHVLRKETVLHKKARK